MPSPDYFNGQTAVMYLKISIANFTFLYSTNFILQIKLSMFISFYLTMLHLNPTYYTASSHTTLELLAVSDLSCILAYCQVLVSCPDLVYIIC